MAWSPKAHVPDGRKPRRVPKYKTGGTVAGDIRATKRWQQTRRRCLSRAPICADPFGYHERDGQTVVAVQVHHIVGVRDAPMRALADDNLACLCRSCHGKVTRIERKDPERAQRLFEGKSVADLS